MLRRLSSSFGIKRNTPLTYDTSNSLSKYIDNLYKYLGKGYCFTKGTFIIGDNSSNLYSLLKNDIDRNNKLTINELGALLSSHLSLRNQSIEIEKSNVEKIDSKMYENHIYKKKISCLCNDNIAENISVRNVKWYQFLGKDTNKYIFFKLEGYPTVSPKHGVRAIKHYFSRPTKSCVDNRREDCHGPCNGPASDENEDEDEDENEEEEDEDNEGEDEDDTQKLYSVGGGTCCSVVKYQYSTYSIDGKEKKIEETYGRIGDEILVPNEINDFIIKHMDSVKMTFDETEKENIYLTVERPRPNGGKRRNKYKKTKRKGRKNSRKRKQTKKM